MSLFFTYFSKATAFLVALVFYEESQANQLLVEYAIDIVKRTISYRIQLRGLHFFFFFLVKELD